MPLQLKYPHDWQLTVEQAVQLQKELRTQVRIEPLPPDIRHIGGIDVSIRENRARAAVAVVSFPALQLINSVNAESEITFPYVPGLLSFRELPVVLAALERLKELPDVLMVDGQGIAHPRRLGIASHLGVQLDMPVVGCAKSLLVGNYTELGETVGSTADIYHKGEIIGVAVRSRLRSNPLIVSVGHRADLAGAVRLVLACGRGYRLPEPTRLAHQLAALPAREQSGLGPLFES